MENETTEQVMNDHTGLRLADAGQYDLLTGMNHDDMIERNSEADEEPLVGYETSLNLRTTQHLIADVTRDRYKTVALQVGASPAYEVGRYNTSGGGRALARVLRQVADRLDP